MSPPYDDPYGRPQSGLAKFLGALNANFRLGHLFGVEVRVFWITLLIMPIFAFTLFPGLGAGTRWALAFLITVMLYFIIWFHEMGHITMGRRYGMPSHLITLSPMGGLAHMSARAPNPGVDLRVALAGPATHLVFLVIVTPLWFFVFEDNYFVRDGSGQWTLSYVAFIVWFLYTTNLWLMVFNLLPFFPMDGGRALRATLSMRMAPGKATRIATSIGMGGAVAMVFASFFWGGVYSTILLIIGITNFLACMQERKAARWAEIYGSEAQLEPWQTDPEAWRGGGAKGGSFRADKGPSRKQRRAEARAQKAAAAAKDLELEVDRILAKVSDVGMAGLTEKEKRTLQRASEARRKGRP